MNKKQKTLSNSDRCLTKPSVHDQTMITKKVYVMNVLIIIKSNNC